MPSLNLLLTSHNHQLMIVHKALLAADTWDQYVDKACSNFPMKAKVYGEKFKFSDPPAEHKDNRKLTIRMSDDVHLRMKGTRLMLGYTWREFLMYPSQNDGVREALFNWTRDRSFSKMAGGINE